MHDAHRHHKHSHTHGEEKEAEDTDTLRKLHLMLEHWIEHEEGHAQGYREWAGKASAAGEEEIAREINLAVAAGEEVKGHLKRAKAVLAAKLVLRK